MVPPVSLVDHYSESESQVGNSGSEDNCNFGNSNPVSSNSNKESSGKNHTSSQTGSTNQNNSLLGNSDGNSFSNQTNGPLPNGNLDGTPAKEVHNSSKDLNKSKLSNSIKKSSSKRSRNR